MPHPSTTDHVALMAQKGDPSAFYSLFGGRARAAYAEARSAGRDHAQATELALAFTRKIYLSFTDKAVRIPADMWFLEKKKRFWRLRQMEGAPAVAAAENERSEFDAALQMMLQREYCGLRRSDTSLESVLHMRRYMLLHPIMRVPIYAGLAAGMAVAGFLYLNLSLSQITLTLSSPLQQRSVVIGSTAGRFFDVRTASLPAAGKIRLSAMPSRSPVTRVRALQPVAGVMRDARATAAPTAKPLVAGAGTSPVRPNADAYVAPRPASAPAVSSPLPRPTPSPGPAIRATGTATAPASVAPVVAAPAVPNRGVSGPQPAPVPRPSRPDSATAQ